MSTSTHHIDHTESHTHSQQSHHTIRIHHQQHYITFGITYYPRTTAPRQNVSLILLHDFIGVWELATASMEHGHTLHSDIICYFELWASSLNSTAYEKAVLFVSLAIFLAQLLLLVYPVWLSSAVWTGGRLDNTR